MMRIGMASGTETFDAKTEKPAAAALARALNGAALPVERRAPPVRAENARESRQAV